jgi:hypothetical protein
MRRRSALLLVLAFGFILTLVEVRYMHRRGLGEYWQALAPLVYCGLAALVALIAVSGKNLWLGVASVVFALGVPVGLYGTFMHTEGEMSRLMPLFTQSEVVAEASEREHEESEHEQEEAGPGGPPPLAPLGIAGLAALGFVACSGLFKDRELSAD